MENMTDIDTAKLRQLASAATPGPWTAAVWIETDGNEWRATGPGHDDESHDNGSEPGCPDEQAAQRDAAFIAAANPTTVLALLDRIAELERACDAHAEVANESGDRASALRAKVSDMRSERLRVEDQLAAMTAARDDLAEIAEAAMRCHKIIDSVAVERIADLRKVGAK